MLSMTVGDRACGSSQHAPSRTDRRAGIMPEPAQSAECSLIQAMNTCAAASLFLSFAPCVLMKKWCEFAHRACSSKIVRAPGRCRSWTLFASRSLICQMPSQVIDVLPLLKATYWASIATFSGL